MGPTGETGQLFVIAITRYQYELLSTETLNAAGSADKDESAAFWKALHAALSPTRWRLSAELASAAVAYCDGICDVTEDGVVRRSFAAVRGKLIRAGVTRAAKGGQ